MLAYGMSEFKLAKTILVPVKEAKSIIDKFFSKVPKVKQFLDMLGYISTTYGYSVTPNPYKRVRRYPKWNYLQKNHTSPSKDKWLGEIDRAGRNSPIQGCNGDIIKLALVNTQNEIDLNNWYTNILLSVYDEIQTECRNDQAENWKYKLQELMINSAKTVIKEVPINVDVKITKCWSK